MVAASEGCVYWITGLSGAGKSTIAHMLVSRLRQTGRPALYLDGDVLRGIFGGNSEHSAEERQRLAITYARLCREVAKQRLDVVCATVSMFHKVRSWNRENIPNYREIYLRVPVEELKRRDSKGLYAAFTAGEIRDVVGLDLEAEFPECPDLVIDNFGSNSPDSTVALIWDALVASKNRGSASK